MLQIPKLQKSYWQEFYPSSIYSELTKDLSVDVAIVGAGITGLTAAYLLKQAGFTVAVLDKATVGGGTTGRTTGKVTSQHNLMYAELQKRLGTEKARFYGQANQAAVEQIGTIINTEKIDCEWIRQNNYVFTDNPKQVSVFKEEARMAAKLGLPATFETTIPLPFNVMGAVKFANQAKINSQKYLLGLAQAVNGNGSHVFEHSEVMRIKDGKPGRIKTRKATITTKDIIVATNVPTLPLAARGTYCMLEYPRESYIVAGRLKKELSGMYISPDKRNYSILPIGEGVILIGGEGHFTAQPVSAKAKYQRLADYAEERFGVSEIINHWSDRDYIAYDNVPLIGKLYPWSKHLYVGTAFKKWGLSNGTVAAMILSDLIAGNNNPWAQTFDSTRLKPVTSFPLAVAKEILGKV